MILPAISYSSFGISLVSQTQVRKIDRISDNMTERMAERALRRAAKRAEMKVEMKATKKAAERAAERSLRREQKLKENASQIVNKKSRQAREIAISRQLRKHQDIYDDNGFEAIGDELLILATKDADLKIAENKYQIKERKYLKGLDMVLIRVATSKDTILSESASEMESMVEDGGIGLNHLFVPESRSIDNEDIPYSIADISANLKINTSHSGEISLGLIDTLVDQSHASLQNEVILIEDFVPYDKTRPKAHGTAVASILVGNEPDIYKGVAIGAKLYAASVFFMQSETKVAATTESLIYALDWMVQQKVQVINMSLSGPSNPLLEIAIKKVLAKGIMIVAAVGNAGPTASLLYPAAYSGVVAVTAVDKEHNVYWRANRGRHVAFSAPGVNIPAAHAGGGYQARSGTSIAAPFVSAILADLAFVNDSHDNDNIVKILEKIAKDLGAKGFDTTYGHGLIQAVAN